MDIMLFNAILAFGCFIITIIYDSDLIMSSLCIFWGVFLGVFLISSIVIDKKADDVGITNTKYVVDVSDSKYMAGSGGGLRNSLNVCYEQEDGSYQAYDISGKVIEHDDGDARIETHTYKWLFLKENKDIVYNVD